MGEIRDTLLRSLKDNPDILKKLEMEEYYDNPKGKTFPKSSQTCAYAPSQTYYKYTN